MRDVLYLRSKLSGCHFTCTVDMVFMSAITAWKKRTHVRVFVEVRVSLETI